MWTDNWKRDFKKSLSGDSYLKMEHEFLKESSPWRMEESATKENASGERDEVVDYEGETWSEMSLSYKQKLSRNQKMSEARVEV